MKFSSLRKGFIAQITAVVLVMALAGCSASQIVSSLTAVTAAVEVALPVVLAAAGSSTLTDAQKTALQTYITSAAAAIKQTITELQTTDTAAVKATRIIGYFAAAAAPDTAGMPAAIASAVNAVAGVIAVYLAQYQQVSVQTSLAVSATNLNLSGRDRRQLKSLASRAEAIQARLASR